MRGAVKTNVQKFVRQESRFKYLQKTKRKSNLTIIEILLDGCFETDWERYCVNRLNGYSCTYWISSEDYLPINLADIGNKSVSPEPQCMSDSVLDGSTASGMGSVLLHFLLTVVICGSLAANLLTLLTLRRLALVYLPICHYFSYLCGLQLADSVIMALDWVVGAHSHYRPLALLSLLGAASCQMLPLLVSVLRHLCAGLFIGLAVDLLRFSRDPARLLQHYRAEWVKNVFILVTVLGCTLNCQFFWTFDLNKGENRALHGRLVPSYMECDFSTTLPLNPFFTNYIWPVTDHLLAEALPLLSGLVAAVCGLRLARHNSTSRLLHKTLIDAPLVLHLNRCLLGYLLLDCATNSLPRTLYLLGKAAAASAITRPLSISLPLASIPASITTNTGNSSSISPSSLLRPPDPDSALLMLLGGFIKYQIFLVILTRFCYFSLLLPEFRITALRFLPLVRLGALMKKCGRDRNRNDANNQVPLPARLPTQDSSPRQEKPQKKQELEQESLITFHNKKDNVSRPLMVEIYC